jgi:hypothetical protein
VSFCTNKPRTFCQDRLGTDIEKVEKKRGRFLPEYLAGNPFVGNYTSAFQPLNCVWRDFEKPQLDTCMDRINSIYIIGDSLMRMKAEKLRKFGVTADKLEDHVKHKGGAASVPTSTEALAEAAGSDKKYTVIVDDFGLVCVECASGPRQPSPRCGVRFECSLPCHKQAANN